MAQSGIIRLAEGEKVDKWVCTKKLGEGACGAVFLVKHTDDGREGALKAEGTEEPVPLLRMEAIAMMDLAKGRCRHVAELMDKGKQDNFNWIVMRLVGKSLQDMKKTGPNQHLSPGVAISVSIQCLEALEDLHVAGYLHRDIKPGNFCVGRAETNELRKIYILDFGMSRRFIGPDGVIRKPRQAAQFRGTPRYAPIASHESRDHSRKEELESWFYMLVDYTNAKLPWKGVTELNDVGQAKRKARSDLNTFFIDCPKKEYAQILAMIDALQYYEAPPYNKIYEILRKCMKEHKMHEFPYDWEPEASKQPGKSGSGPKSGFTVVKGYKRAQKSTSQYDGA
ncbi:unnamed protein product, partial [Mesorhabditis spiculigera]